MEANILALLNHTLGYKIKNKIIKVIVEIVIVKGEESNTRVCGESLDIPKLVAQTETLGFFEKIMAFIMSR
jgi:hypothetical protein